MDYGQIPKGEVLDGRFEVVRLVKSGGMGAVYQVTDRLLGGKTCGVFPRIKNQVLTYK